MLPSYQRTLSNFLDLTFQKLSDHDIVLVAQFAFLAAAAAAAGAFITLHQPTTSRKLVDR